MNAPALVTPAANDPTDVRGWATLYAQSGWPIVRVKTLGKAPIDDDWPNVAYTPDMIAVGDNVGLKLGLGLVDVDCDCPEAIALAPKFLPPTATFGRNGDGKVQGVALTYAKAGPCRHWLFACEGITTRQDRAAHVELRGRSRKGEVGLQTVVPGSVHESGEPIVWIDAVPPAAIPPAELSARFVALALATVVARAWASPVLEGQRHDACLAFAGALWYAGWTADAARAVLLPAWSLDGQDAPHREQAIRDTWEDNDRQRWGMPALRRLLVGEQLVALANAFERLASDVALPFRANVAGGTPLAVALAGTPAEVWLTSPPNDSGAVDVLIERHGADLRFVEGVGWLRWSGAGWRECDGPWAELERLAREMSDTGRAKGGDAGAALAKRGLVLGNTKSIRAVVELASHRPELRVDVDRLDADPWLLNCANGTVDLCTGVLRPAAREDLITKCTGFAFDPNATCPRFERFMLEIFAGDVELARHVLRFLGSALTGIQTSRCLQVWYGEGKNGKSTLIDLLQDILGDYARALGIGMLLETRQARSSAAASPDLAALRGVRFATSVETQEGRAWNESLIKQLTGDKRLTARHLNKEEITFAATWTLALATNHKPVVRGTDAAIWDRLHLIPFSVRFDTDAGRQPERGLAETLRAEAPGILRWLVHACVEWQHEGLEPPASVRAAVAEYRVGQDVVGQFLAECVTSCPGALTGKAELYARYKRWAEESGEFVFGKKTLNQRLAERGFVDNGRADGRAAWVGVRVSCGV